MFGDENLVTFGYPQGADPTAGATLNGLAPGVTTVASQAFPHSYPWTAPPTAYPGTDQIYVGSNQTGFHDGYSQSSQRQPGPLVITGDFSSLLGPGETATSVTLGIGADDFQFQAFGQPFTASINGVAQPAIVSALEALNQTGPYEQFLSVGLDPSLFANTSTFTLSIDEGGDGGDGFAVDFLTVGVTTSAVTTVPLPNSAAMGGLGLIGLTAAAWVTRRRRHA
jgi:hypothetical protein